MPTPQVTKKTIFFIYSDDEENLEDIFRARKKQKSKPLTSLKRTSPKTPTKEIAKGVTKHDYPPQSILNERISHLDPNPLLDESIFQ